MTAAVLVDDRIAVNPASAGWAARLELRFARERARTVLAAREHAGPLRVQKPLYPEGPDVCQVIVVHPPGGIVGGDSLTIAIDAGEGTHAQLTTPGTAKWYRSPGPFARARTTLRLRAGSLVEWLPQDAMLFDGARASIGLCIELERDARFLGWEVMSLGRTESGEQFASGSLRQSFELIRDGALLYCERAVLEGGAGALRSGAVLNGAPVFGTLMAAGVPVQDDALAACRAVACASGDGAVTRLPDVFIARFRGASATAARGYFVTLWKLLRPTFAGRVAVPPRIWNT